MSEPKKILKNLKVDKSWTLFLDRDGVINRWLEGDYVKSWEEFEFLPGVLDTLPKLSQIFGLVIVVTNQQGIGRRLFTEEDLFEIHRRMVQEIENKGGRIHGIYCCPHRAQEKCPCRKPKTGLALRAREDFPQINFKKSLIVGDSTEDMEFGRALGMACVFLRTKGIEASEEACFSYTDLRDLWGD